MQKTIVSIPAAEHGHFLVEVEDLDFTPPSLADDGLGLPPGAVPAGAIPNQETFERLKSSVRAATTFVISAFTEFNRPSEIEVEFSISLKGKAGIPVIVEQSAEASFKIKAKWINTGDKQ